MDNQNNQKDVIGKLAGRVTNIVLLGFFSTICCLPIVTIGASFTAVNEATDAYLNYDEKKPLKLFFDSFKRHFPLATYVWLINLVAIVILVVDFLYYRAGNTTMDVIAQTAMLVGLFLLVFEMMMVFVVISQDLATTIKEAFAKAIDIAFVCFGQSLSILVLTIGIPIIGIFLIRSLLLVLPGVSAYANWLIIPKMLKKYKFKKGNATYQKEQRNKK